MTIAEARGLLSQALTRSEAGEHSDAIDAICAATKRLGKCDRDSPVSDVYAHTIDAENYIFGGHHEKARFHLREALQFCEAAEVGAK